MNATKRPVSEKTKALILEKALEIFREQGFEAATIRDIAKSAKVATGAAPPGLNVRGAILADHMKNLGWRRRQAQKAGKIPRAILEQVRRAYRSAAGDCLKLCRRRT
jgi:hypothetical protein